MCVRGHGITKDADVRPSLHAMRFGAAGQTGDLRLLRGRFQQDHALTGKNNKGGVPGGGAGRVPHGRPTGLWYGMRHAGFPHIFLQFFGWKV